MSEGFVAFFRPHLFLVRKSASLFDLLDMPVDVLMALGHSLRGQIAFDYGCFRLLNLGLLWYAYIDLWVEV